MYHGYTARFFVRCMLVGICSSLAHAEIPEEYYDSVDFESVETLKASIHDIIDDHTRIPYTSSATDTWDVINQADQDPLNPDNVLTIYKNATYKKISDGTGEYSRQHSWPKSFGFPNDNSQNYAYTDLHHLFAADASYNSSRSNLPFGSCDADCSEKETNAYNGEGGTSGVYPGESNWRRGSGATGTWEVWEDRKGDIARAMFYMAVRYEGGSHGITEAEEPDLELTGDEELIANSNTGENESIAYMGRLSTLIEWHENDPVDDLERQRNDVIAEYQGNRNPFVDHPEYVEYLFVAGALRDPLFDGFELLKAPVYINPTDEDDSRVIEPKSLVSGTYATRLAFKPDGSGEISRTLNWSVESDVFSWEVTESSALLTLDLDYNSGGFTRRTLTRPSLGDSCGADSDDRQRDIDTYGDEYERLLAFVDQNPGPYNFEAACQIEVQIWTEKITYESTPSENWRVISYDRQTLVLTQDLLDAGWDGPSTLVSVAPALSESIQYPRQYNDVDLTYSVFSEPTGKWVLPIYADPTGAGELDSALIFSEEVALTQTDPGFGPAPNFGTAVSHWSEYDFDWELDEQALVLENQDLRLQYRVLDKQDDILLLEFDLTDKRSGERFIVAERGAKFDGTGEESASKLQVEPPIYYQSLLNGKPSFVETPGTCDGANGVLFINQDGVYRFFMDERRDCRFDVSTGALRDAEILDNSLFMNPPESIFRFANRRREWRVVATLEDERLLIIESSRYLDESLIEQGYDFFINPRTIVAEVADLSLTGDAWLVLDIDEDGLTNREEDDLGTAYGQADSDADGLTDGNEVSLGTDPLLADTDADGLNDSEEITLGTNPLLRDTDADGYSDEYELASGTDPLDPESVPEDEAEGLPTWLMYLITKP